MQWVCSLTSSPGFNGKPEIGFLSFDAQMTDNPIRHPSVRRVLNDGEGMKWFGSSACKGFLLSPHNSQSGRECRTRSLGNYVDYLQRGIISNPLCALPYVSSPKQGLFQVAKSTLRHSMWISVKCSKHIQWKIPWRCPGLFSASGSEADPYSILHTLLPSYWYFNP